MSRKLLSLLLLALILSSCSDESTISPSFVDSNPQDVELKIINSSNYTLEDIKISNRSISKNYGTLRKGKESDFVSFSKADSYFGVEFIAEDFLFEYEPDTTDELLNEGFYKISIYSVDTSNQTFAFLLEED